MNYMDICRIYVFSIIGIFRLPLILEIRVDRENTLNGNTSIDIN